MPVNYKQAESIYLDLLSRPEILSSTPSAGKAAGKESENAKVEGNA